MLSSIKVETDHDCTIRELLETMAKVTEANGEIVFDSSNQMERRVS